MLIDWDVGAGSWRRLQVAREDESAGGRLVWLKPYVLAVAVLQHSISAGGLYACRPSSKIVQGSIALMVSMPF